MYHRRGRAVYTAALHWKGTGARTIKWYPRGEDGLAAVCEGMALGGGWSGAYAFMSAVIDDKAC